MKTKCFLYFYAFYEYLIVGTSVCFCMLAFQCFIVYFIHLKFVLTRCL
jgi:hypothetical protein